MHRLASTRQPRTACRQHSAAQQNAQVLNAMKEGLGIDESSPTAALAEFAQQTMTNYVEVQKRWLELATQLPFVGSSPKR